MKLSESIDLINKVKPNGYSADVLVAFINELESMAWVEVFEKKPEDFTPYKLPEHQDVELIIVKPYDSCYLNYVAAKIDFQNEEAAGYQNNMEMFNSQYLDYKKYMNRMESARNNVKIHNYW
jgi:hypothetical protein